MNKPEKIHKQGNIGNIKRKSFVLIKVHIINIFIGKLKRKIYFFEKLYNLFKKNFSSFEFLK